MPIIARVGRNTVSTRLLLGGIYAALIAGGLSMLYPFVLMLATATTGEPDVREFRLVPRYWYDQTALYQRFVQERYQVMGDFAAYYEGHTGTWSAVRLPEAGDAAEVRRWEAFVAQLEPSAFGAWYVGRRSMPGKVDLLWRQFVRERRDDPSQVVPGVTAFSELMAPYEQVTGRLWPGVRGEQGRLWEQFKQQLPAKYRRPVDGVQQWRAWLKFRYEKIEQLNAAHGTSYASFSQVALPVRQPSGPMAEDWERWVRNELAFRFVGIDDGDDAYRQYLLQRTDDLRQLNAQLGAEYASVDAIHWPPAHPATAELDAISEFLRSYVPAHRLYVDTPDLRYAAQVAAERGIPPETIRPPYVAQDLAVFQADASQWRWWGLTRNFAEVIDYIAVRGRSLWNTVFLVSMMILAAVTVNPLAAYALSRFRLGFANQVLIFLLATMAFPGEVTMIPNFLLLRAFPVWSWIAAIVIGGTVAWMLLRGEGGVARWIIAIVCGGLAGIFGGAYLTPWIGSLLGVDLGPVSLLNTFPALILPRMANGFGIFLLKGFFDSLPEEVFEAGRIDGASELRMLWQVAFPLSKPVLAVVVLQTFTAVYGSYLWALLVCQDDSMWTLMVHMFQLQQWAPPYVTMAAAVLCSIPTLLVFVLAQNVIMRGVVIPVYK